MKRANYLWMGIIGMCLMFASCNKKDNNTNGIVFTASIEQAAEGGRTNIDPQGNSGYVNWSAGDKIQINNGEASSIFSLSTGAGSNSATFTTDDDDFVETGEYVAVYPHSATINADGVVVTLSNVQNVDITSHSFAEGFNPMVAASTTNSFNFKNVCGGLGFTLEGNHASPTIITGIVLTAKKTSEKIWGNFNVTNYDNPTMEYVDNGGSAEPTNVAKLAFAEFTLGADDLVDFYFILPQGVLSEGFKIEILTVDDALSMMKETESSAATIVRNKIWRIGNISIPPQGSVPATFSVDDDHKVYVSMGNLQYKPCTGEWQFAEHQYDYVGNAAGNNTPLEEGRATQCELIDLFGWGTSGYNHGAVCYQPWSISKVSTDYYAYGDPEKDLNDGDGKADWGYNPILNGGNEENSGWRTMTNSEWHYMFDVRVTPSGMRYAKGNIAGMNGLFMLPDEWEADIYPLNNPNEGGVAYDVNTVTMTDWEEILEPNGVMFLPCAGDREGLVCETQGDNGDYWSATHYENPDHPSYAHQMYFTPVSVTPDDAYGRIKGRSVRLVKDVPNP